MLLGIRSLAVAMHLEIYWVYIRHKKTISESVFKNRNIYYINNKYN
ncbi:hypothetical protein [Photorhabdus australis]